MAKITNIRNFQIVIYPSISLRSMSFFLQEMSNDFIRLDIKYHIHIFDTDPPTTFFSEKNLKPHALQTTLEILPNGK